MKTEKAIFGAGCFWHVQEKFDNLKGVVETEVGFMGGSLDNPSYKEVCSGNTGHIEVCLVKFNPNIISFGELLDAFWKMHNPTQLNRQGADVGEQYLSVIFYCSAEQKKESEKSLRKEQKRYKEKIVTRIASAKTFFRAEEYHQKYYQKNGSSCAI